jgi:hypothetical protein
MYYNCLILFWNRVVQLEGRIKPNFSLKNVSKIHLKLVNKLNVFGIFLIKNNQLKKILEAYLNMKLQLNSLGVMVQ